MTINNDLKDNLIKFGRKFGSDIVETAVMADYSTIKAGSTMPFLSLPENLEALTAIVKLLNIYSCKYHVLGSGSNTLFVQGENEVVGISLSKIVDILPEYSDKEIKVAGGARLGTVISELVKRGISSIEGLVGIPGTIGGAIKNNAGYKCDISMKLKSIKILDRSGYIREVYTDEIEFGYRYSSLPETWIILEATFSAEKTSTENLKEKIKKDYKDKMNAQPLGEKTLGSVFKNPEDRDLKAWELISNAGLRGKKQGGAKISEKHANFIVNNANAAPEDILELITLVQNEVYNKFKVKLETEIEVVKC